jgi:hypothetical protein
MKEEKNFKFLKCYLFTAGRYFCLQNGGKRPSIVYEVAVQGNFEKKVTTYQVIKKHFHCN